MTKPIIAVDIDEVIADLLTPWLARYNKAYGDNLRTEDIRGWDMIPQVKPECGAKIFSFLTPDIYDTEVMPIPGSWVGVDDLRLLGRVIFVTSGNGTAKLAWLKRHGFIEDKWTADVDFFMARDKSLIKADYLLDDCVANVKAFPGVGILIQHWHNTNEQAQCGRVAVDLSHAAKIIKIHRDWLKYAPQ